MTFSLRYWFQEGLNFIVFSLISFHDVVVEMQVLVLGSVVVFFIVAFHFLSFSMFWYRSKVVEFLWTVIPAVILSFITLPSLWSLYLAEDSNSSREISVTGRQWYWDFGYVFLPEVIVEGRKIFFTNLNDLAESTTIFVSKQVWDSFSVPENISLEGKMLEFSWESHHVVESRRIRRHRCFRVDSGFLVEVGESLVYVGRTDVIHSFAIPSLGVKIDAVPGKLNTVLVDFPIGVFFGQCSELCGVNHSLIPIVISVVDTAEKSDKGEIIWGMKSQKYELIVSGKGYEKGIGYFLYVKEK